MTVKRILLNKTGRGKHVWRYLLTCLIVATVLAPVMNENFFEDVENFWTTIFFGFFYTSSGLYGAIWLFQYLDKKFDWIKDLWKRLIIGILVVEVWSVLAYAVMTPVILYLFKEDSIEQILLQLKANLKYPLLMGLAGMVIIASVEFFKNWKSSYLKREKLRAETMAFKYEALHNQLNPHFLFNSFNVLSGLVYEDQALAVKFIDQLNDLYKKVLSGKQKELVPLQDELDFIQSYIFLLKIRFDEKLDIVVDVPCQQHEVIAPMVLQLLLENAVKHNKASKSTPLKISISREENNIAVVNDLSIKKVGDNSRKTGLQNIQQRYSFFTDQPIEILRDEKKFSVRIPILKAADNENF